MVYNTMHMIQVIQINDVQILVHVNAVSVLFCSIPLPSPLHNTN